MDSDTAMTALPFCVGSFFKSHYISYQLTCHPKLGNLEQAAEALGLPPECVARTILLKDSHGLLMAVLPLTRLLHLTHLRERLGRRLEVISGSQADRYFPDCEPGSRPPLGEAYHIPMIVDKMLLRQPEIYFEPGNQCVFVKMEKREFASLVSKATKMDISVPQTLANQASKLIRQQRGVECLNDESQHLCQKLTELPHFVQKPLALTHLLHQWDCAENFAMIDEEDKIFFAALFEEQNRSTCQFALNILTIFLSALPITHDGPLGYTSMVEASLYNAFLAALYAQKEGILDPALAFLVSGCQYSGILALGTLFPPEFQLLNRLALAHPNVPISTLEQRLLGMGSAHDVIALGHAQVGAWLLKTWGFPIEVSIALAKQNQVNYKGEAKEYVHLAQLVQHAVSESGLLGEIRGVYELDINDEKAKVASALLVKLLGYQDRLAQRVNAMVKEVNANAAIVVE